MRKPVIGLRVTTKRTGTVRIALTKAMPTISAGASVRTGRAGRPDSDPSTYFQATGMDDRQDYVEWFLSGGPKFGDAIEIEVGELEAGNAPFRKPRKRMNWRKFFADMARRRAREITTLEKRLRRLRGGNASVVERKEPGPPRYGLELKLNGRSLGRLAVGHPGTFSIGVWGSWTKGHASFRLQLHGGVQLGPHAWRWYAWKWNDQSLASGHRVTIEFIRPSGLEKLVVGSEDVTEEQSEAEILQRLEKLRRDKATNWYAKEARSMIAVTRKLPKPRRYRGGKIRP